MFTHYFFPPFEASTKASTLPLLVPPRDKTLSENPFSFITFEVRESAKAPLDNLSAKEEYERQLRLYNSEAIDSTRQKLAAAQTKNETLEKQVSELEMQIAALKSNKEESDRIIQELREAGEKDIPAPEPFDEKKYQLKLLKEKALEAQKMLDEKVSASGSEVK